MNSLIKITSFSCDIYIYIYINEDININMNKFMNDIKINIKIVL